MGEKLLEIKGVSKIFRVGGMIRGKKLVAVDDVTLSIDNDKPVILSIVGESGCGKSTLCKMVLRLHNPDMGEIILDGKSFADKKSYDPHQFKLDVQPIFQNPYESFSSRKTVDTYLYNTALRLGIAKNRSEADKVVDEVLKSVGMSLQVVKGKYPTQFSGGELQRVSIARALITRPKLIIADEPVSALDVSVRSQILNLLEDLQERLGLTYLFISHDLSVVEHICDRIIVMYLGKVVESAPVEELFRRPLHPYTQALLSAAPQVYSENRRERITLEGDVPSPANPPVGCRFHTRCPYATEQCKTEVALQDIGEEHFVACHRVNSQGRDSA